MDVQEKAQILDKIHKMRMRVAERQILDEPGKAHSMLQQQHGNDKDKIMEQYYAVKRSIKPEKK